MKKIITDNPGGFPLSGNDPMWLQEGYAEAIYGIMTAFGIGNDESFILSGCTRALNGANVDYAAGWMVIRGEIFEFPAQTIPFIDADGERITYTEEIL